MDKFPSFDISASTLTVLQQKEAALEKAVRPTDVAARLHNPSQCIVGQDSGCTSHQMRLENTSYKINTSYKTYEAN